MVKRDDIITRLMRDPDFLQTHTDFLRAIVNNAREIMESIREDTCKSVYRGIQCQLESGHQESHSAELVWGDRDASNSSDGTPGEDDDSREVGA